MRSHWVRVFMIGAMGFSTWSESGAVALPEPTAPLAVSTAPLADGEPASRISGSEKAVIYQEFRSKLREEERAFDAEEKSRRKALVRNQSDRRKEWRERERRARRAYFESHTSGPDRRHYVQDFVRRKKEFDQNEKTEWTDFNRKQREARKELRMSQKERTRQVNEALSREQRPEF